MRTRNNERRGHCRGAKVKAMKLSEEACEKMILRATNGLTFFNASAMDLSKMGQNGIQDNTENYIQSFSSDAREIFEHFKFSEFVGQLADANLLFKVVQIFAKADLYPEHVTNHDMGLVFEELIRRFAESSNETAGEHFTPRDIVNLTTSLVFSMMMMRSIKTASSAPFTIQRQEPAAFSPPAWSTSINKTPMP